MVLQAVAQSSESAHGQTADVGILSLAGQGEGFAGKFHQFPANVVTVHGNIPWLIQIEGILSGGHDNCQIMFLGIALNACAVQPVGVTAHDSVKQIQRLERLVLSLLGRGAKIQLICGQDHTQGNSSSQSLRLKCHMKYSHRIASSYSSV